MVVSSSSTGVGCAGGWRVRDVFAYAGPWYLCLTPSPGIGNTASFCIEISRLPGLRGRQWQPRGNGRLARTDARTEESSLKAAALPFGGFGSPLCLVSITCVSVCVWGGQGGC